MRLTAGMRSNKKLTLLKSSDIDFATYFFGAPGNVAFHPAPYQASQLVYTPEATEVSTSLVDDTQHRT
jgi:hypothetical protein